MTFPIASFSSRGHALPENLLHQITSQIRKSLQLQDILQSTVTEIRSFLETDRVMVYRFHPDNHGEVIAEAIDAQRLPSLMGLHFPDDDIPPQARELFLHARQRSIVDLSTGQLGWSIPPSVENLDSSAHHGIQYRPVDPCHIEYLKAMGVQSSVAVPILQETQLWGLLVAHHTQARTVTEAELHFLQLVVDQVEIAIAQSALLAQVQAQAQQEQVANHIATLLHSDVARPLQSALEATVAAIRGSGGRLLLMSSGAEQAGELYVCGSQPGHPTCTSDQQLEFHPLWQHSSPLETLEIADIYQDSRCQSLHELFQTTSIRSLLIIPLHQSSVTLGYLTLFRNTIETETLWAGKIDTDVRQTSPRQSFAQWRHRKEGQIQAWTEADRNLLTTIKTHFTLAVTQYRLQTQVQILNAQLEQQVQHQTRDLMNIQFALDQSSIVAITDKRGMICYVNDKFCEISGYSKDELIGQSHRLVNSGYHPKQFFGQMWQTIRGGSVWRGEIKNRAKDGTEYWVDTTIVPLLDEQGQVYQYVAIRSDITDRKQAEAALQRTTERLQEAQRVAQMGSWEFDVATETVTWSDELFRIFGLEPGSTAPSFADHRQLFHPDDWDKFQQTVNQAISEGIPYNTELRIIHAGGEIRLINVKAAVVINQFSQTTTLYGMVIDITDRKQAEIDLQQITHKLQKAQQIAHIGSWEYDLATEVITWSDETFRIFGLTPGQPVPPLNNVLERYHPDDREKLGQVLTKTLQAGTPYDAEFRIIRSDGMVRHLDTKGEALRNDAGNIIGAIGTVLDITERKQAEAQLQEQEQFLRSIYDGVEYAIFVVDVLETGDFHYAAFNAFAENLTEHSTTEIEGKTPEMLFGEEEGALIRDSLNRCLQAGIQVFQEDCLLINGQRTWLLTTFNPLHNAEGEIYRIVGTSFDITARKQAEEVLHQKAEQEQLLNQLANQIRSSLDLDQILKITVESIRDLLQVDQCTFVWYRPFADPPTWECVYEAKLPELPTVKGLYPSQTIGSTAERMQNLEIIQDDDTTAISDPQWRKLLLSMGFKSNISIPMQTNIGEIGVINCGHIKSLHPWQESEVELLIAVTNQIAIAINQANLYEQTCLAAATAQAQAQQLQQTLQELQQTQAQLVQTEKMSSLGQLVAGVAHEINNPVSFIYGNLRHAGEYTHDLLNLLALYQEHYPNPNPTIQAEAEEIDLDFLKTDLPKLLSSMKVGAERIQKIVLALRTFSRMDEAEVKAVNIHDGIDSTLMILQSRIKETAGHPGIAVVKHYGELPLVECYAGQLNQVFMNILSNAIDALDEFNRHRSPEALRSNPATITISTYQKSDGQIQIEIADNGLGMDEQVQRRLFEPFFTTKPIGKGTGLGLSISYQVVVDKHGGKLTCHSTPGKGTQFVIELPLAIKRDTTKLEHP